MKKFLSCFVALVGMAFGTPALASTLLRTDLGDNFAAFYADRSYSGSFNAGAGTGSVTFYIESSDSSKVNLTINGSLTLSMEIDSIGNSIGVPPSTVTYQLLNYGELGTTGINVWNSQISMPLSFLNGMNTYSFDFIRLGSGLTSFGPANFYGQTYTTAPSVPEPGTWLLLIVGFFAIAAAIRSRGTAIEAAPAEIPLG